MGTRYSSIDWLHVTIWAYDRDWERLNYLSAGSESLSTWLVKQVLAFEGCPVKRKKVKGENGKIRPLCVDKAKWGTIKDRAGKCGMRISQYILACVLPDE